MLKLNQETGTDWYLEILQDFKVHLKMLAWANESL